MKVIYMNDTLVAMGKAGVDIRELVAGGTVKVLEGTPPYLIILDK